MDNHKSSSWTNQKFEPIDFNRVCRWKKNQKDFSCPEYRRLMRIEEGSAPPRLPTESSPCMFCAHPECPLRMKVIC